MLRDFTDFLALKPPDIQRALKFVDSEILVAALSDLDQTEQDYVLSAVTHTAGAIVANFLRESLKYGAFERDVVLSAKKQIVNEISAHMEKTYSDVVDLVWQMRDELRQRGSDQMRPDDLDQFLGRLENFIDNFDSTNPPAPSWDLIYDLLSAGKR